MSAFAQQAHKLGCPAIVGGKCFCVPPQGEMSSLWEIKQRLAAIEQGQGVICERLDAMRNGGEEPDRTDANHMELTQQVNVLGTMIASFEKKLDAIQGELLHQQFTRQLERVEKNIQRGKKKQRGRR